MNKIYHERVVKPEETIKKQKDFIDKLELDYSFDILSTDDEEFWFSKMELDGIEDSQYTSGHLFFGKTRGKGKTRESCLASNYGEFLERLSWDIWKQKMEKHSEEEIEIKNLTTGEYDTFNVGNLIQTHLDAEHLASGNIIEEARYHAIMDVIENGTYNICFSINQLETQIAESEKIMSNFAKKYRDNYHIFVQRDLRIPSIYIINAFRKPDRDNTLFRKDFLYEKNGIYHFSGNTLRDTPFRRVGLSVENNIHAAIGESLQFFHLLTETNPEFGWNLEEGDSKKYPTNWGLNSDFPNNETSTIEGDNEKIINEFKEAGFNLWEIDITLPESPIKAVKILSDYALSGESPHGEKFLNRIFDF